jgi:STE24 endopeptidase
MATPDPQAAAQAWLEQLPIAQRMAASDFTEARAVAWGLGWVLVIAVALLVLETGLLGRVRRRIERDGPRPWLSGAVLAGLFAAIVLIFKTPFDAFVAWRGDILLHQAGGVADSFQSHLAAAHDWAPAILSAAIVLVPPLQWLIRRRPRTWPLIVGAPLAVAILAIGWLPYALSSGPAMAPLPAGPTREALLDLIHRTGIPVDQIYRSKDPSMDADVTGGFGHANLVVGPRLDGASPAEVKAFAGHVAGHYVHGDIFTIYLLFGVLTFLGLVLVQRGFGPLARLTAMGRLTGPADPEGLPLVLMLAVLAIMGGDLTSSAYIRWVNVRADQYSLDHAREPDGLAGALEGDWDHESVDPSPWAQAIFYTHPPLKSRLVHAMTWKAGNGN